MRPFTPREYQRLIIAHILEHPRCAVWAGMGLGKTVSTLLAVHELQKRGEGPALVLAPVRVAKISWPDEAAKWDALAGTRVFPVFGTPARREDALEPLLAGVVRSGVWTMGYENIPWLEKTLEKYGIEWPFEIIVADEATRLKGFRNRQGGVRARTLGRLSTKARRFIELTGTPAPNGLQDLWGQFWFLDGGKRLGRSMSAYLERWFRPVRVGADPFAVRWDILPGAADDIMEKTRDLVIRLNAEDWFDIREPLAVPVPVTLPSKAMTQYRAMERSFYLELEGEGIEAANAASKTLKCLQMASGFLYADQETEGREYDGRAAGRAYHVVHEGKLDALESIESESGGTPLLVSYQFKHEADAIRKRFPKARILDKDPATVRAWNEGRIPMLLAHPASCGHGLSLQDGGNILVFFSTGWNLEEHDQIIERIGPTRQAQAGHKRPVYVYSLIAKGTMDEVVQERIRTKREVLDLLMERRRKCREPLKS